MSFGSFGSTELPSSRTVGNRGRTMGGNGVAVRRRILPGDRSVIVEEVAPGMWYVGMEDVSSTSGDYNRSMRRVIHCYVEWDGATFIPYFSHVEQATINATGAGGRPVTNPLVMNEGNKQAIRGQLLGAFFDSWMDGELRSWKYREQAFLAEIGAVEGVGGAGGAGGPGGGVTGAAVVQARTNDVMGAYLAENPDVARALREALDSVPDDDDDEGDDGDSGEGEEL